MGALLRLRLASPACSPHPPPILLAQVERKHGVDRAAAQAAQAAHAENAAVQRELARVKRVIFGEEGEAPDPDSVEVPAGMTADSFYALFGTHVSTVEAGYAELVEEARRSVKDKTPDPEALNTYFKLLLQRRMPEIMARAQAAVGLDEEDFKRCLIKYQAVRALRATGRAEWGGGAAAAAAAAAHRSPRLASPRLARRRAGPALHGAHRREPAAAGAAAGHARLGLSPPPPLLYRVCVLEVSNSAASSAAPEVVQCRLRDCRLPALAAAACRARGAAAHASAAAAAAAAFLSTVSAAAAQQLSRWP